MSKEYRKKRILKALAFYGVNNKVTLWGDGSPLREFLWSEDMADASVHIPIERRFQGHHWELRNAQGVFSMVQSDGESRPEQF